MRIEQQPHAEAVAILVNDDGTLLHQIWLAGHRRVVDVFDASLTLRASHVGRLPVLPAPLGDGTYLVNGRGPDDQYWFGVAKLKLP